MSDLLKMNLFRMKRTKLGTALAIASIAAILITFFSNYAVNLLFSEVFPGLLEESPDGFGAEKSVFANVTPLFIDSIVVMLSLVFAMLFFNVELSSGYTKNLVGYEGNKYALAGANLLTSALYTTALLIASAIIGTVLSLVFYEGKSFSDAPEFALFFIMVICEATAYISLLLALGDLTGKNILFMILGAVYIIYGPILYLLIDSLVHKYLTDNFSIGKYTVIGGVSSNNLSSPVKDFLISIAIALAAIVLSYFIDVKALKKRELK